MKFSEFKKSLEQTSTEIKEEEEQLEEGKYSEDDMMEWVFDKMENSDIDIDDLEKAFVKKFGRANKKVLDQAMSDMLD